MKTEIEAKFLSVDPDAIRGKLTAAGAVCEQPMRMMRRMVFENEMMNDRKGYLRIRDESHKTTMTYKQFDALSIDGAKEIEITVSDFDAAVGIVRAIYDEWIRVSFQESRRETWQLDGAEIVIDEWPWLELYIEIEASSQQEIDDAAKKLGLDMAEAAYGDVMVAYRAQYPHLGLHDTIASLPEVRFGASLPEMFRRGAVNE